MIPAGAALLALLAGPGAAHAAGRCGDHPWCDTSLSPDARAGMLLGALTQDEKVSLLAGDDPFGVGGGSDSHTGTSDGVPRVGIPTTYYSDGPVGVRQGQATAMPIPMALAASFDPALAELHGSTIANEAKDKGNDVVFAPTVNIMRTPLGGRTFEGYGEDPFLVARTAVGWIKDAQSQGIIANVKHFAANNQEGDAGPAAQTNQPGTPLGVPPVVGDRYTVNSAVDERTLREIYLPQFEAAVKDANVGSVMCSYNRLNGQYACENDHLLQQILEREWGFKGYVLADYGAAHNTIAELNNGLDFEPWPGFTYNPALVNAAMAAEQASPSTVDDHIRRILRTDFAYGFFDRPAYANDDSQIDKAAHLRAAGQIEEAGITLLKNDGVLPLDPHKDKSVAIIGGDADGFKTGGGSADVQPFSVVTPRDAITRRAAPGMKVAYDPGDDATRAATVAKAADVVLLFASDFETEGSDKSCMSLDCGNAQRRNQDELIQQVSAANPKTVVVLETGAPVLTPWRDRLKGLVEAWYPGADGGDAIARVLFGDADPSGRLPATFPKQESDIPTAGDPEKYPGTAETVHYKEGLDVGYRWYDAKGIEPAFPFGFGLSYTSFAYSGLSASPDGVSVTVTNTGSRAGIEVPQVYLGFPAAAGEPPKQLKGYQRVSLAPGKSTRVTFPLDPRSFSHWDTPSGAWAITPGCYDVLVGASSRDVREQGQIAQGGAHCAGAAGASGSAACAAGTGLRSAGAKPRGHGLAVSFTRGSARPVQVDVLTFSRGHRVTGGGLVARFAGKTGPFTWNGRPNRTLRHLRDGYYEVRLQIPTAGGDYDTRVLSVVRRHGRFRAGPHFAARDTCGLLRSARLTRPVFGGSGRRPLVLNYRLGSAGNVNVTVLHGRKVVARYRATKRRAGRIYRVSLRPRGALAARGVYTVRLKAVAGRHRAGTTLRAARL
jgi:beta-glucosidase